MTEEPKQPTDPMQPERRKGCSINLMFPVEDDAVAFALKKQFDAIIPDVQGKRYTFQITEM